MNAWFAEILLKPDRVVWIGECWVWLGAHTYRGYGKLRRAGKSLLAHRVSYEHHVGPIPDGICVLHRCDNPPCVNPDHLFLGTQADNAHDMHTKGRGHGRGATGQRNPHALLTEDAVLEIRTRFAEGCSTMRLSREYGVTQNLIGCVLRGDTWRHVGGPTVTSIPRRKWAER